MSRSRHYHHGSLRPALVDEAVAQVRAVGADKVSLRALAGTVGVSPSAAYAHFPDREALLVAVGEHGFALLSSRMLQEITAIPGDDDAAAVARLEASGSAYIGFAVDEPHLFRLMFGPLCRKPAAHGSLEASPGEDLASQLSAYGVLEYHLRELEQRKLLTAPPSEGLQLMIWSIVHGFAYLAIEGQIDLADGAEMLAALRSLIVTGNPTA